jgi:hypothetical protein
MNVLAPHPYVRKLDRVLDRMGGLYRASDILALVREGTLQMFAEGDSIAITRIGNFPRGKALEVIAVVGDINELRVLHDRLLIFAAEVGASVIQAFGRKGWMADAQKRGWKVKARSFVYQREIE